MFDYFWLICGVWVGFGSFVIGKMKSKDLIKSGEYSEEEVNNCLKAFAAFIFVPSFVFWGLQISIGTGAGVDFLSWPNPQKLIALFVLICLWTYLLVWTLFLGGAVPLGRCLRLIGNFPKFMLTPIAVKSLVIILVVSGVFSLFMKRV